MQATFFALADTLCKHLRTTERLLLHLRGESTHYARFNRAALRQAGHLHEATLSIRLVADGRHAAADLQMSADTGPALAVLEQLRSVLAQLPPDPHLLLPGTRHDSVRATADRVDAQALTDAWLTAARDTDAVGILAAGTLARGFADSEGQRNWFARDSWLADSSLHVGDRSIKLTAADLTTTPERIHAAFAEARERLPLLERPFHEVSAGVHRAYLAPAAVADLLGIVARSGFGAGTRRRGISCLQRAVEGERLSPLLTLVEDTAGGLGPAFDGRGFPRPDRTVLLREGRLGDPLVNARNAAEFDLPCTGAGRWEGAESLVVQPGDLPTAEVLDALGTGLFIANVHYLNFSDHGNAGITGVTRFACWYVEDGEIVAPIPVMRFDDSAFAMFGEALEALTDTAELFPAARTYPRRTTESVRAPGALVSRFTLAG
jgi:predicted Zn-dependent protease